MALYYCQQNYRYVKYVHISSIYYCAVKNTITIASVDLRLIESCSFVFIIGSIIS